jgi:hypothetical protein
MATLGHRGWPYATPRGRLGVAQPPQACPFFFFFFFFFFFLNKFIYLFFNKFIFFLLGWTRVADV